MPIVPGVAARPPYNRQGRRHFGWRVFISRMFDVSLNSYLYDGKTSAPAGRSWGTGTMNQDAAGTVLSSVADANAQRDSLSLQVQGLIDEARTVATSDERRNRDRFPIPYTFRLTPIDREGLVLVDETTTVVGKDLSLTGIGFSHDHELSFSRAIITLDHPKVGRFAVEAEIVWTRPTPIGLFESGCRLVRTINGHTVRSKK
jgi:hypothetical protein